MLLSLLRSLKLRTPIITEPYLNLKREIPTLYQNYSEIIVPVLSSVETDVFKSVADVAASKRIFKGAIHAPATVDNQRWLPSHPPAFRNKCICW